VLDELEELGISQLSFLFTPHLFSLAAGISRRLIVASHAH
jgi:hypothetical protein